MIRLTALAAASLLAACVTTPMASEDGWAALGETTRAGPALIEPLRLVEDSRCPANARCVWEGRVIIEVAVTLGETRSVHSITAAQPLVLRGTAITLDQVEPESFVTQAQPEPGDYRFHFTAD